MKIKSKYVMGCPSSNINPMNEYYTIKQLREGMCSEKLIKHIKNISKGGNNEIRNLQ